MQEGSLRVDANVNLHVSTAARKIATPIVEVKNVNSFRAVERAIEYEARRQYAEWQETGNKLGDAPKRTFGWDDQAQVTKPQRAKEESSDYRYFPDPDLAPVTVTDEELDRVSETLEELPGAARRRLQKEFGLTEYDADVIVNQGRAVVQYYTSLATASGDDKRASNWLQQYVFAVMNEREISIEEFPITSENLAELIKMIAKGQLDNNRAKDVFAEMLEQGVGAGTAVKLLGIQQVDDSELQALCEELLNANPKIVADLQAGNVKAVGALIGQAKKRNPNANPNQVREICLAIIQRMP
jgi:aspartyl-tRNA(Asn)/glutamyl-tRNA(Gln) amidotransferase subunit B